MSGTPEENDFTGDGMVYTESDPEDVYVRRLASFKPLLREDDGDLDVSQVQRALFDIVIAKLKLELQDPTSAGFRTLNHRLHNLIEDLL